ncbi:MAG: hypothetical protein N2517_07360 [Ignavibacteria bacterium]|nr:hypothetical protein [Ignavibacteria bacterium]
MKVIQIIDIEDCLSNVKSFDLLLSDEITKNFILNLGKKGYLQYYSDFPKPFFKIRLEGICDIKGVEGSKKLRVIFRNHSYIPLNFVIELINIF